ncbi:helix-turn-helix domain-containing protein [Trinickia diaoshuihuensis]|uniref:helix-turn-helix domain-containing protein n=1 Tax=Trinickia diaoshuihuensis TaxID=2292265 RepID=UPI000E24DA65|nr:helix-turn-helix domain-containing protein [Trinickia diaoshuihuensis]
MYLGKTDTLPATPRGQHLPQEKPQNFRDAIAGSGIGCRIGVVISDDCSPSDVAKVLAKTCEHFGDDQSEANKNGEISITVIAGRSGFVLRENARLPVWCEAICDVNPLDFNYFVVPECGSGTPEPRPEIVAWLARAGAGVKIIELPLDTPAVATTREPSPVDTEMPPGPAKLDGSSDSAPGLSEPEAARVSRPAQSSADVSAAGALVDQPSASERIRATVEWLNEHYGSRISISAMAERALMSERNFLRRFRAEMGHTPHEYLSKVRLENARKLLITTALPVDKIARHCGLFNGDHLRKHFVKQFGMSPVEYRSARFNALHALASTDSTR